MPRPLAELPRRAGALLLLALATGALPAQVIVPTGEGQFGDPPAPGLAVIGSTFVPRSGAPGNVAVGTLFVPEALTPLPSFDLYSDQLHGAGTPSSIDQLPYVASNDVAQKPPRADDVTGLNDLAGAFAFMEDGSDPATAAVVVALIRQPGGGVDYIELDNIPTFPFADDAFQDIDIAVDDMGRVTIVFVEDIDPGPGTVPRVTGRRFDGITGADIDDFGLDDAISPDLAILDPNGDRIVVAASTGSDIIGAFVDLTGPTPTVQPPFTVSTTGGFTNVNPAVAADPATGAFVVAWENVTAVQGDPVNIRARRYDAQGSPVGNDFQVNSSSADAQGQPAVTVGPNGEVVVVWASDPVLPGQDLLDVFLQAYDAAGNPIGGETRAHASTTGIQDRPAVRFLPEPDAEGRPQFVVSWRDVGEPDGTQANGTGQGYSCHSIAPPPEDIFADGFESGDTSSWSTRSE